MQKRDGVEWTVKNEAGDVWKEPIDMRTVSYPCRAAAARQHHDSKHVDCSVRDNERVHDSS